MENKREFDGWLILCSNFLVLGVISINMMVTLKLNIALM